MKAKVVGATRGPKIDGFIYKPKSNNRRRYGHRQDLSVLEITGITKGRSAPRPPTSPSPPTPSSRADSAEPKQQSRSSRAEAAEED